MVDIHYQVATNPLRAPWLLSHDVGLGWHELVLDWLGRKGGKEWSHSRAH